MSQSQKIYKVIGLMSGTSLDGIDVALIETDGHRFVKPLAFSYAPYDESLRERVRACFGARILSEKVAEAEYQLTMAHAHAVRSFLEEQNLTADEIDLIGFHGQTITHDPANEFTWQIGNGDLLAQETRINVIYDFRSQDVKSGGQGAPLIPVYHQALAAASGLSAPVAILNIGGVSNVTWIGEGDDNLLAFDCGPGNALIDDKVLGATGQRFDKDGEIAKSGKIHQDLIAKWMAHPYFAAQPPKSLDRDAWAVQKDVEGLSLADAVATLTAFTVEAIVQGAGHFPQAAREWYVTGGGRKNSAIMDGLSKKFGIVVKSVDALGWNGDALEAEGFAYMAVRSVLDLPISFPTTTGVKKPKTGGKGAVV